MESKRLHHIDVWRFIAIAMVVLCHLVVYSHPWYKEVMPGVVWRLQALGNVGVQVFFCISGFVICRGMVQEAARTNAVNLPAFYIRRAYRILPPLAVFILCVAMLSAAGVFDVRLSSLLLASTFLCNIDVKNCGWELGHTWSLAFEEQFYLLFPLLFIGASLAVRRERIMFASLLLAGIMFGARVTGFPKIGEYLANFIFMLAGCICALYWNKLDSRLRSLPIAVWDAVVILIPTSSLFIFTLPVEQFVRPLVMPMLICIAVFGTPTQHPRVQRAFSNPLFCHLGRISYGIYLWQQLATANYGFGSPVHAVVLVLAAVMLSHFSFVYLETRLIRRGAQVSTNASGVRSKNFSQKDSEASSHRSISS